MLSLRRTARLLGLLLPAVVAAACDPCSGIVGCERADIAYQGRIVTSAGVPVSDVEVTFAPDGSGAGRPVRAVTDARGIFILRMDPPSGDGVTGTATVAAPGSTPYQVDSLRLEPIGRGNLASLNPWLTELVVLDVVTFYFRGNRETLDGGTAAFKRVGGVETAGDPAPVGLSPLGQVWLEVTPRSRGEVRGRWEVQLRDDSLTLVSNTQDYPTEHRAGWFRFPQVPLGPAVAYRGKLVGPAGGPVADAEVTFVRTGGLAIDGETIHVRSDSLGTFILYPPLVDPLAHGEVRGRLEIRPPAPLAPRVVPELVLPTHEDDELPDLPPWKLAPAP